MRQDRFTQQAQEVLAASQDMVRTQRHAQWDIEHVLLALLQHQDGLAAKLLDASGVDVRALTQRVADTLARSPKLAYDVVQVYTTPRIVKMLETANAEHPDLDSRRARRRLGAHPAGIQRRQGADLPGVAGRAGLGARRFAHGGAALRRVGEIQH
jgi:ATP-dependent Clp protease ATP-binding subunit ClpA